jgi:hypothetical protein
MSTVAEEIGKFVTALEADGMQLGSFDMEKLLQQICRSEPPATVEMSNTVLAAIRRRDLSLRDRTARIVSVLRMLAGETVH